MIISAVLSNKKSSIVCIVIFLFGLWFNILVKSCGYVETVCFIIYDDKNVLAHECELSMKKFYNLKIKVCIRVENI